MSAAGSLLGRKRERPAQSPGPKGPSGQKTASKALERLASAHTACTGLLTSQAYPNSLSEVALALQHILGAKLVVLCDSSGPAGATGVAPAHTDTHAWLESLGHQHLEGRESCISTFDLEPRAAPSIAGIRRFVVVPLATGRGQGALWLGFGDHGPSSPEELLSLSILGEHLSLLLQRVTAKQILPGASSISADQRNGVSGTSSAPASHTPDELISLAAHELRTPLTPITMLLQSLERKARTGTADVDTILRARKQVGRLTHMISDLLDLSRLRENRLVLTPVRLDLGKAVRDAIQSFQEADPRHSVELNDETSSLQVMADESRLAHTLSNLLDHVAHATSAGGVIHVILERRDTSAAVTIRADRPVFGGEILKSIEVVDAPRTRPEPIALGLLVAQSITTRLGGTVSLAARQASETRVEATFPLSPAEQPAPVAPRAAWK